MTVVILFGTETGNAELVALDIQDSLADAADVSVVDMSDARPEELADAQLVILVISTYGEGELPVGAEPFYELLKAEHPDLSQMRFSVFGLGDSTYDHYNRAGELFVQLFVELGAIQVGDHGRHDAAGSDFASDAALEWVQDLVERI